MDLKEAINELKEWVEVDRRTRRNEVESDFDIFCENKNVAIEKILQELDNLQKENEELISEKTKLLLTDLSEANRLYDEENKRCMMLAIENNDSKEKLDNSISKDKIREKIEEIAGKQGYVFATEVLGDLLKEE